MNRRTKARIKLILNAPDKVSTHTKLGSNIITILCWVLYIYLWIPLITLIAWALGITHAYDELSFARQLGDFRQLLIFYALIVVILGGGLLLWALKEYLRFKDSTRRRPPTPAATDELAKYSAVQDTDVIRWHRMRRMVALHDEQGKVVGVEEEVPSSITTGAQPA